MLLHLRHTITVTLQLRPLRRSLTRARHSTPISCRRFNHGLMRPLPAMLTHHHQTADMIISYLCASGRHLASSTTWICDLVMFMELLREPFLAAWRCVEKRLFRPKLCIHSCSHSCLSFLALVVRPPAWMHAPVIIQFW